MITEKSFWGMPLRTQAQRRFLVCLYYGLLLALGALALWLPQASAPVLFGQTFILGGLLGGIRAGGPVKPYRSPPSSLEGGGMAAELTTLDLDGSRARRALFPPLDEREEGERNYAHFRAYRLLLLSLAILTGAFTLAQDVAPVWLSQHVLMLVWLTLVYAASLPQSVLLWSEPVIGDEMQLVPRGSRV